MFGLFRRKTLNPQYAKNFKVLMDEAQIKYPSHTLSRIRAELEKLIADDPAKMENAISQGMPIERFVLSTIAQVAGDELESGRYHLHRVLNPLGDGESLLQLHDWCVDQLAARGDIDQERAENDKSALRTNMLGLG